MLLLLITIPLLLSVSQGSAAFENEEKRILGGRNAIAEEAVYNAAIMRKGCEKNQKNKKNEFCDTKTDEAYVCGGALVAPHAVVTAATCFMKESKVSKFSVRAGNLLYKSGAKSRPAYSIILREKLPADKAQIDYQNYRDLALVIVRPAFPKDKERFVYLQLPQQNEDIPVGLKMNITGWGQTKATHPSKPQFPDKLRFKSLATLDVETCKSETRDKNPLLAVSSALHVCTVHSPAGQRYTARDSGMCRGDEGNPLVKDGVIYGVYSFQKTPCNTQVPAVFMKIAPHTNWIRSFVPFYGEYANTYVSFYENASGDAEC